MSLLVRSRRKHIFLVGLRLLRDSVCQIFERSKKNIVGDVKEQGLKMLRIRDKDEIRKKILRLEWTLKSLQEKLF